MSNVGTMGRASRRSIGQLVIVAALVAMVGASAPSSVGATTPAPPAPSAAPAESGPNVYHDTSIPLRDMSPAPDQGSHAHPARGVPHGRNGGSDGALSSQPGSGSPATLSAPSTNTNFAGIGNGDYGFTVNSAPPDTTGAVGPNHYIQMVNSAFAVFNKTGAIVYGPVQTNTLWSGFGGGCQTNNDGDGTVRYDQQANRWILSQFSVTGADGVATPFLQCVAVSQTSDPTGAYYRYSFQYTSFPDYPKMGVWPDAYYETFNMFNAAGNVFLGAEACAYDRGRMLTGAAATQKCFTLGSSFGGILPSNVDGATAPPAGSPNYILGLGSSANQLDLWRFHADFTTPANATLSGPTVMATAGFSEACNGGTCIPQAGTTQQLDSLADRLMDRVAYRNFGDHESLVVTHSVAAGSSTGLRWYEVRNPASTPTIYQQGTYAPDSSYRWMGSIAMDHSGDMGLGFSVSSSSLHPEIHYTGRLVGDTLGTMPQGEGTIVNGAGSQSGPRGLTRWGDYSNMSVDPTDDCTFWYTNEFLNSTGEFNWSTRIGSFKFPSCGTATTNDFSISANPTSLNLAQNASGTSTISTAVTSGSAQTVALTVSGVPSGATASVAPTSVTAGNSSTLTVNAGTATAGNYTITVTGTEGSVTHATTVAVTITAPPPANDFSISANPTSASAVQGSSASSTISTAVTSGSAQSVSLSASGLPSGATASFNPTSVTGAGSSTLTIGTTSSTPTGNYSITVTGTGTSATHTTSVTLAVTAPASGGITNGGFETGSLSGWTSTGSTSVTTTHHSGTYAAQVGSASPGTDSTLTQTFTAPTGTNQVSFWYRVTCPDSVTYDWASATLKDNTANSTATVLANTCTNTGVWVQATSANLVSGHSYTLTLANHDDNYAGDPTYTIYDDVTLVAAASPPPASIVNGGFENGLTGWTRVGATSNSTVAHSGSSSAQVGGTGPTNGDSSLSQAFTAPSGTTKLVLWYEVHCPDTVTYDWATVTLKDNTVGTTATLLGKTCTNSGAWVQVSGSVTAGHSYTVTLVSHDDNYASDPTYTLYDDVLVQ